MLCLPMHSHLRAAASIQSRSGIAPTFLQCLRNEGAYRASLEMKTAGCSAKTHTLARERQKCTDARQWREIVGSKNNSLWCTQRLRQREREKERCLTQTASYLADGEYYLPPIERTHRVWMCLLQCFAPTTRRARRRLNLISVFAANECAQLALIYPQMNGASAHTDKRSHCTEPACLSCKTSTLSSSQWVESRFEVIQRNKNGRDWHKTNFLTR